MSRFLKGVFVIAAALAFLAFRMNAFTPGSSMQENMRACDAAAVQTRLAGCTELLAPVIEKHGIGAVTCYTGNPLAHSFSLGRYTGVLLGMSGIPISYSPDGSRILFWRGSADTSQPGPGWMSGSASGRPAR